MKQKENIAQWQQITMNAKYSANCFKVLYNSVLMIASKGSSALPTTIT